MSEPVHEVTALEVIPAGQATASIVRATPGDVSAAFREYQQIQAALDKAMPDCIMTIQGRRFRKKSYWRAIATAFNLTVELRRDERIQEGEDWGWLVAYRATAPNGRSSDGDGTCMASEKRSSQATIHNVRAHAHTRAWNRAVSNLVGFGEVSAEEMVREEREQQQHRPERARLVTPEEVAALEPEPPPDGEPEWFGETTGFGKKDHTKTLSIDGEKIPLARVTWRQLAGGKPGGGRQAWLVDTLEWARQSDNPGKVLKLFMERAVTVLAMYDAKAGRGGDEAF
jgi:hypothetical protein